MKTGGVFTLHEYRVTLETIKEPLRIVFFGDVHRDSPEHADGAWQEFLEYAQRLPKQSTVFLGMGDYLDCASTSERIALTRAEFHESTKQHIEDSATSNVGRLARELGFMKGRLIGLINGNHFYDYPNGINSDQRLCEKLGCKYLGVSAFIRLNILFSGRYLTFDIWAHHGAGGARLPGGSINRVDQMRDHAEADAYVMGHDHKRGVFPANPRLSLERTRNKELRLKQRQSWLIRSGSFLKSYEDGHRSYNVDAARGPSSLGHVELELKLNGQHELTVRGIA